MIPYLWESINPVSTNARAIYKSPQAGFKGAGREQGYLSPRLHTLSGGQVSYARFARKYGTIVVTTISWYRKRYPYEEPTVADTFAELYTPLLKAVFTTEAQKALAQGADGLACAHAYAERGKPEFVLAYLLLIEQPEEAKRELLAHSYEQRATLSESKAEAFDRQFHRPFPLIKLEAQKDRLAARQVRQGRRVRTAGTKIPPTL